MPRLLPAALGLALILALAAPAAAQSWDTQALVREASTMNAEDLLPLRQRADGGDARAQILMGLASEMGAAGLAPNSVDALDWFSRAADQGIAWAEAWAGDFYYTGSNGVPKDLYKAMERYRSAAEHGDSRAAIALGRMYFFGEGVSADLAEAGKWFQRGAPDQGELAGRMAALASAACADAFCLSLRQLLGAVMTMSDEYAAEWDDTTQEWVSVRTLPRFDRCGFTSSDRTQQGEIRNFFCDSEVFADANAGSQEATTVAEEVAATLPPGWSRDVEAPGARDSHLFTSDGFPRIRVTYNRTPGMAPQRVTLLIGR
jgi:hypothetical protein